MTDEEQSMNDLEQQVPALSAAAVEAAYWQALAAGRSVLVRDDGGIYEVFPDGSRQFVKEAEQRVDLPIGSRFQIR